MTLNHSKSPWLAAFVAIAIFPACDNAGFDGTRRSLSGNPSIDGQLPGAEVCYPGTSKAQKSCVGLENVEQAQKQSDDYDYLKPTVANNFPPHLDPIQYDVPVNLVALDGTDPHQILSPNFELEELMALYKGPFGIYSRGALSKMQSMRDELAQPMNITSAYRSPNYNAGVGGATWSRHKYGDAVDFFVTDEALDDLAELCSLHGASFTQTYKSHVHCDWRNHNLDEAFYGPALIPSSHHNVATTHSEHSSIEIGKIKSLQSFRVHHPEAEDGGELTFKWQVFDRNGLIYESESEILKIPMNISAQARHLSVTVGGSISLSLDLK